MNQKAKKKLCWNCEGDVDVKAEKCPYCGVSVDVSPIPGTQPKKPQTAPPYKPNKINGAIPAAPYPIKEEATLEETKGAGREFQNSAIAIGFLLLGSVLTIFSIVLALFSDAQGRLTLSWNGEHWYYYLLLALPLLFLGWRASSDVE